MTVLSWVNVYIYFIPMSQINSRKQGNPRNTSKIKLQKLIETVTSKQQINQQIINEQTHLKNKINIAQSSSKKSFAVKLEPLTPNVKPGGRMKAELSLPHQTAQKIVSRRSMKLQTEQIQQLVGNKNRMAVQLYQKTVSAQQSVIKQYVVNLITKVYADDVVILMQASNDLTRLKPIWWNVTSTIFQTMLKTLKTNPQLTHKLTLAYINLSEQLTHNQNQLLSIFQDKNHITLITQTIYIEKIVIFILILFQQQLQNNKTMQQWLIETIKRIIVTRKCQVEIINQMENQQKFNKLKKQNYLIREKKLLQINRLMTETKETYNKFIKNGQNSQRLQQLQMKPAYTYQDLQIQYQQWKTTFLHLPLPPFLHNHNNNYSPNNNNSPNNNYSPNNSPNNYNNYSPNNNNNKKYTFVFNPQHIFYVEDKKNACVMIRPFAEKCIQQLAMRSRLVIFTHRLKMDLQPFLASIDGDKIEAVLDRSYETYKQTKRIKDIGKFGVDISQILVMDIYHDKYYGHSSGNCIPITKHSKQDQIINYIQKAQQLMSHDQPINKTTIHTYFPTHPEHKQHQPPLKK